jgi:hypothetical protein
MKTILVAALLLPIAACASVTVQRVTDPANQLGVRYWRPTPYLVLEQVTEEKSMRCNVKVIMLPDKSEEYAITFHSGWGTAEASPVLQDGWNLTSMTGKADSKTAENLTAIAGLITAITPLTLSNPPGFAPGTRRALRETRSTPKCEGLIKIIYDNAGNISGFQRISIPVDYTTTTRTIILPSTIP